MSPVVYIYTLNIYIYILYDKHNIYKVPCRKAKGREREIVSTKKIKKITVPCRRAKG
jgi:hypothetical protein